MFSNKMIRALLVPIILEQLLNSIMGTADTMMVSNVGSAAISAVSLVDSINILVIQAFSVGRNILKFCRNIRRNHSCLHHLCKEKQQV